MKMQRKVTAHAWAASAINAASSEPRGVVNAAPTKAYHRRPVLLQHMQTMRDIQAARNPQRQPPIAQQAASQHHDGIYRRQRRNACWIQSHNLLLLLLLLR